jgi:hypothetical protein
MHETARHAIHSLETLNVSVEALGALQQQAIDLSTRHKRGDGSHAGVSHQIQTHIESQVQMVRALSLRAQSNKERLQNEIALVRKIRWPYNKPVLTS